MKLDVVILQVHHLFLGFRAVIARMSDVPTDLARHARIQGLDCLHLSLVLRIILKFLEEEINLRSEHVRLLDGAHAPLAWLESFISPILVGHHLLDQSSGSFNGQREEGSTRSSIHMITGCLSQSIVEVL